MVDEVRIRVRKKDGSRVKFSQLSEGEQQLLTVLGLLLFTQDDELLYLLDEPDTDGESGMDICIIFGCCKRIFVQQKVS